MGFASLGPAYELTESKVSAKRRLPKGTPNPLGRASCGLTQCTILNFKKPLD